MAIEFKIRTVQIQSAEMRDNYPQIISALQPYLPAQKLIRRRRTKKQKQTVAKLIDKLIYDIDNLG